MAFLFLKVTFEMFKTLLRITVLKINGDFGIISILVTVLSLEELYNEKTNVL